MMRARSSVDSDERRESFESGGESGKELWNVETVKGSAVGDKEEMGKTAVAKNDWTDFVR